MPKRVETRTVPVWGLPIRFFHWSLVGLVALAWVTAEAEGALFSLHVGAGLAILALIVFRLIWGFIGPRPARFSDFVRRWRVVRAYARDLLALSPPRHMGHNPIGGWMVLALLAVLALVVASGLFGADGGVGGPLAGLTHPSLSHGLKELHEGLASLLGVMVGLHVVGVLSHGLVFGENLVGAMWSGRKKIPAGDVSAAPEPVGSWRAALALSVAVAVVWAIMT